jgi:hypothetical protein
MVPGLWCKEERAVEQEQIFYVIGMGNLPDSGELADYYYPTNPIGYGLQAFRTKEVQRLT